MKRNAFLFLIALTFTLGLSSCSNSKTVDSKTTSKATESEKVGKMDDFFSLLNGTTAGSAKAYNRYATKGLKDYYANECVPDFCDYELKNPRVISSQGICSTIETTSGLTVRTYKICWLNDSISGIDFVGMNKDGSY